MALKTYKPVTNGQRQLVLVDRSGLHKGGPVKSLTEGKTSKGGWVMVRDAVKRPHKGLPMPASVKKRASAAAPAQAPAAEQGASSNEAGA